MRGGLKLEIDEIEFLFSTPGPASWGGGLKRAARTPPGHKDLRVLACSFVGLFVCWLVRLFVCSFFPMEKLDKLMRICLETDAKIYA